MLFKKTPIEGVTEFVKKPFTDNRGVFTRLYDTSLFEGYLCSEKIKQINHSVTRQVGSVRGLHLQKHPYQEIKIIQCLRGRVFDFAVDLRRNSETFLMSWFMELSPELHNGVILPKGVAHGFQVLEENSELLYFHTSEYQSEYGEGFNYKDPLFKLKLPLVVTEISGKDDSHGFLDHSFEGF